MKKVYQLLSNEILQYFIGTKKLFLRKVWIPFKNIRCIKVFEDSDEIMSFTIFFGFLMRNIKHHSPAA